MSTVSERQAQLVAVRLADETYGIDVSKVRGIIAMQEITKIPKSPPFVEGVVNLRGKVTPVIDLRRRFDLDVCPHTKETRIVIIEIGSQMVGMVVDAVTEILRIPESTIEPPSPIVAGAGADYIRGIGKVGGKPIAILDMDEAFGTQHSVDAGDAEARDAQDGEAEAGLERATG